MPGLILIKDDVIAIASLTLIFSGALSFLHYIYNTKSAKKAFIASFFMLMVEALIYVEITFSGETSFLSAVTRVICTLGFMVGSAGMMLVAFTKEYRYSE
ncbi:MAG: hypothetical protein PHI66_00080 [Candidatus Pacebacteria bacterium]|nr:hypothetical protein [Candidatus Paceibacterota bacterium]